MRPDESRGGRPRGAVRCLGPSQTARVCFATSPCWSAKPRPSPATTWHRPTNGPRSSAARGEAIAAIRSGQRGRSRSPTLADLLRRSRRASLKAIQAATHRAPIECSSRGGAAGRPGTAAGRAVANGCQPQHRSWLHARAAETCRRPGVESASFGVARTSARRVSGRGIVCTATRRGGIHGYAIRVYWRSVGSGYHGRESHPPGRRAVGAVRIGLLPGRSAAAHASRTAPVLSAPEIGLNEVVFLGDTDSALAKGPGLVSVGGSSAIVIVGHRTIRRAPFRYLSRLHPGDEVTLRRSGRTERFVVQAAGTVNWLSPARLVRGRPADQEAPADHGRSSVPARAEVLMVSARRIDPSLVASAPKPNLATRCGGIGVRHGGGGSSPWSRSASGGASALPWRQRRAGLAQE